MITLCFVLLGAGFLGGLITGKNGQGPMWSAKMDQAPIRMLALFLIVLAVLFAFLPEKESKP
ncbi:MAG: hypothetical protein JST35_12890 [Armatimonadetes bacterium]|jgi:hypothetical protein|nr:hypothetical protein [Armatimonadota bacterium]